MYGKFREELKQKLAEIIESGLYKSERHITSVQQARISVGEKKVLNMCANNYLGLADNKEIIEAVKKGLDARGFGMASIMSWRKESAISSGPMTLFYTPPVLMPMLVFLKHYSVKEMPLSRMR